MSFDPKRLTDALKTGRRWILLAGLLAALLGAIAGYGTASYTGTVLLIPIDQRDGSFSTDPAGEAPSRQHSLQTVVDLARTPGLLRRVATAAALPVSAEQIAARSEVSRVPGTDLLRFRLRSQDARQAVQLVNTYAAEVVGLTEELQKREADRSQTVLTEQLLEVDAELEAANEKLAGFQRAIDVLDFEGETARQLEQAGSLEAKARDLRIQLATLDTEIGGLLQQISQHHPALLVVRQELDQALLRYTDEHPKVKEIRARAAALQEQLAEQRDLVDPSIALNGSSLAQSLYAKVIDLRTQRTTLGKQLEVVQAERTRLQERWSRLPERQLEYGKLKGKQDSLRITRDQLARRQHTAEMLAKGSIATYQVFQPAKVDDFHPLLRLKPSLLCGAAAGLVGALAVCLLLLLRAAADGRIRSERDLERATGLPVLASLPALEEMTEAERERWAFQTLVALRGRLTTSPNQALVCAFTSCLPGEGRSTWVSLLAAAATRQGYRVLTICANGQTEGGSACAEVFEPRGVRQDVQTYPQEITEALESPCLPSSVQIAAHGWVWDLQRRKQWQHALQRLQALENLVVFLELPPASQPEAVLLADKLSPLIWLCRKDMTDAAEARVQIGLIRSAGSDFAGAVFNRAASRSLARVATHVLLLSTLVAGRLAAQSTNAPALFEAVPAEGSAGFLSVISPDQMADWQKRLTLGPGDALSISIYDEPDSGRVGLFIGPDGRLSYLQARDVEAAGLTIEELREKLESVLATYYRPPIRVMIFPESFSSKKYYMLGNVLQKGVFQLERPITVVEAVTRSGGFLTARNTLMVADLSRSFLVRAAQDSGFHRVGIDFEALFLRADLSQNLALAPNDVLYFAPLDLKEVYVLGQVGAPGPLLFTPDLTVLRAIIAKGGFAPKAYRKKVLVIRGSLSRPETFIVNTADILDAQAPDFRLQPRDIVYVNTRPFAYAQDLLGYALLEYTRAVVIAWTGQYIGPWTKEPWVPSP